MTKSKITKADREALAQRGFVEGNPNSIPENISPVLKSQLLAEMGENDSGSTPGVAGNYSPLDHDRDGVAGGHVDNRKGGVKK